MATKAGSDVPALAAIGLDIGKDVFHLVGLSADGTIAFRRKINASRSRTRSRPSHPALSAWRRAWALTEAFARGRDFGAWLGLVPRQYSTGGRSILGRISKPGSGYLRALFIQAAHVILMRPHNWERFSFGAWLKEGAERLHRNKLATALANKLTRIAWSVLRNGRAFDIIPSEAAAVWGQASREFATENGMERIDERALSLMTQMAVRQPSS
jgi:hypothetical protein